MDEIDYNGLTGMPTATQQDAISLLLPLFLGFQLQLLLFGLAISMFYDYLQSDIYARHTKRMKASLWGIFALLCLSSLLSAEEMCWFGIWQNRTGAAILSAHWPSMIQALLAELVCAAVQILLTFRAANFFPQTWLRKAFIYFNLLLVLTSLFGASLATGIGFLYLSGHPERALPFTYSNAILIWLTVSAACDCSISLGLYLNIRRRIADAGVAGWAFKSVVRTGLRTAAYTSLFAVGGAIAAVIAIINDQSYSTIDWVFLCYVPLPSLSVLSLFTTLSSNTSIGKRLTGEKHAGDTGIHPSRLGVSYTVAPVVVQPPSPSSGRVGFVARSTASEGAVEQKE